MKHRERAELLCYMNLIAVILYSDFCIDNNNTERGWAVGKGSGNKPLIKKLYFKIKTFKIKKNSPVECYFHIA